MHIKWLEDKGTEKCEEDPMLTHRTDYEGRYSFLYILLPLPFSIRSVHLPNNIKNGLTMVVKVATGHVNKRKKERNLLL
jgi:hypothetical protein